MLLGEDEIQVRTLLGEPTRRSYETPEHLYYERRGGKATLFLNQGVITRIRFHVDSQAEESLQWYSALGLRQSLFDELEEEEAKKLIIEHYEIGEYIEKPGKLWIYPRGIGFQWSKTGLSYIEIFRPWRY